MKFSKSQRVVFSFFLLVVFLFPGLLFAQTPAAPASATTPGYTPPPTIREDKCDCFCGDNAGARKMGDKMTATECRTTCQDPSISMIFVTCAADTKGHPNRNLSCFTSDQCDAHKGVLDQPKPECPSSMGYCFPKPENVMSTVLNVKIGSLEQTADLGEYVSTVYRFMISAGTLIAIVLVMVGGAQWVLASGSGDVSKAKKRIMDAVIGLVLLLFTYLIMFTVNPYLVQMKVPQFPMVRTITLPDDNSCEKLKTEGNTVDPTTGKCGDNPSALTAGVDGASIPDGMTCQWADCSHKGLYGTAFGSEFYSCITTRSNTRDCHNCIDIDPKDDSPLRPSPDTCARFAGEASGTIGTSDFKQRRCGFTKDEDALDGWGLTPDILQTGTCAEFSIVCSSLSSCRSYDDIVVDASGDDDKLDEFQRVTGGFAGGGLGGHGNISIQEICEEDPCGFGCVMQANGNDCNNR